MSRSFTFNNIEVKLILVLSAGFHRFPEQRARDLYRDITVDVAPAEIIAKVSKLPVRFAPWSQDLYDECMEKQRANFGNNKVHCLQAFLF